MKKDDQILKCRDDKDPVIFSRIAKEAGIETAFKLSEGSNCSWVKKDETFGPEKLRSRIEPWLTALFQSEHFALLVGSGLSYSIHRIATGKDLPGMNPVTFTQFDTEINVEAKNSAVAAGRKNGNIK